MAHSVEVNITSHPLSREENGIVFVVNDGEGKFGELTISSHGGAMLRMDGGVRWRPKNKHQPHFMTWAEFDRSMREARKD
jgi:hypothetical protein